MENLGKLRRALSIVWKNWKSEEKMKLSALLRKVGGVNIKMIPLKVEGDEAISLRGKDIKVIAVRGEDV